MVIVRRISCIVFLSIVLLGGLIPMRGQQRSTLAAGFSTAEPKDILKGEKVVVRVYDFNGIEQLLKQRNDTTYVVNFWATWCKPCVEELPHFEALSKKYAQQKVKVVLVSLDFPSRARELLIPFVEKRAIQSEVVLLDDPKQNTWIPKVDKAWSGALPATIIFNRNKSAFYEKSFTFKELDTQLLSIIN